MLLADFLRQTQAEVREGMMNGGGGPGGSPYPELAFTEVVMQHMSDIGMTFDPVVCHYSAKISNAAVRISGYAVSEDCDQMDLFVSLYSGADEVVPVPDSEVKSAAEQCLRFLGKCAEGKLLATIDASTEAYALALTIRECYSELDQIRIYVITDRQTKAKIFKPRELSGKTVKLEVMDIERLFRHYTEGVQDEITVNFKEIAGSALPCVCIPGAQEAEYDCALTVFPGQTLFHIYERFGPRLLEANVRSFLSATKKVNRGIRDTLRENPERFMAYNNGIVVIASEVSWGETSEGGPGIVWLKGMQIVNGGQTTASIYFTKKKAPHTDLGAVSVPAKVLVLRSGEAETGEQLAADISRYANSQNAVQQADLSASHPFHRAIETLSTTVYCPDGVSRWFYERAAGSYNTMLTREGTTTARLKKLRESTPAARKISKTDLAKYLHTWQQKPHVVSLGSQKNFVEFMKELEKGYAVEEMDAAYFKRMIAKAILFKTAHKLVRPMFPAFQGNITVYLVSLLSLKLGSKMDLAKIWLQQDISAELKQHLGIWAGEVNKVLQKTAHGRMISEWAKKPECWTAFQDFEFSAPRGDIPEVARVRR
jgi:hypothetical protein